MKLDKDWYSSAAREIIAALKKVKDAKEVEFKEKSHADFWASEDGIAVQALKNKYNKSCNIPVISCNLDYLFTIKKVYIMPHHTAIEDKLRLMAVNATNDVKLRQNVMSIFIAEQAEFYEQNPYVND